MVLTSSPKIIGSYGFAGSAFGSKNKEGRHTFFQLKAKQLLSYSHAHT